MKSCGGEPDLPRMWAKSYFLSPLNIFLARINLFLISAQIPIRRKGYSHIKQKETAEAICHLLLS
ncbi:hypothetical protein SAMN02745132_02370 [Enterovibrio nigricans DSM 22720]|uniref:Uncharacterized protein n=1 Tax=Enterovibrio nigricans DSM 22720 TaxID=1121868 RepID=A0A1T4USA3_9GAMM|nr:hypothetical protein SAMN02745132_02370 [Enterovibrio nigricans DSM 22720]